MEIVDLWNLFQQWHEHGNSGDLELSPDGSGGIRVREVLGDSSTDELIVSWNSLTEGITELTNQLTSGSPAMASYLRRKRPRRRPVVGLMC